MRDIKETEHQYKGFTIKGTSRRSSGGYVLGGRHFVEGGLERVYIVCKDGRQVLRGGHEKLLYAKEDIDRHLKYLEEKQSPDCGII